MSALRTSLVALAFLSLSGCLQVGNQHLATEARTVAAFTKVSVQGGLQLEHSLGDRALTLTTDQNLLTFIETVVEGDTLVLRPRRNVTLAPTHGVRLTLTNDTLLGLDASGGSTVTARASAADSWALTASGGSTVTLTDAQSANFSVDASGGSRANVQGLATDATVTGSGGSHLDTDGLVAENVTANASGGSTLRVRATKALKGDVSGGSTLTVTGSPAVRQVTTSGGSTAVFE